MVECPHCQTIMEESALFCPGCGAPRTFVRERLEREAAETGAPYEQLLARARDEDRVNRAAAGFGQAYPGTSAAAQPRRRSRLWLILGIIGGVVLFACVACVAVGLVTRDRLGITIGEGEAGAMVKRELTLAAQGRQDERWRLLHPAHREAVPLNQFSSCSAPRALAEAEIILERNETVDIPLIGERRARAVAYAWTDGQQTLSDTVYAVEEGNTWHWLLDLDDIAAYRAGQCP